jgi:hypothetical protein
MLGHVAVDQVHIGKLLSLSSECQNVLDSRVIIDFQLPVPFAEQKLNGAEVLLV